MELVLSVANVGKRYATYPSLLHRLSSWFGFSTKLRGEFWANSNISFEVRRGEAVALIGANGAGKSTLLKMITGTVRPATGSIHVAGRISAILELGLGFNPELTGRQNIRQAGALMGYSQDELTELMPGIEAFAEIGLFFDQPLRVYSSGMQARLAFSLATARRPDLLIVDEVLSVGDSYFQHKSFDRIREFKAAGTTILLVTHALADARSLCDRVVLIDKGKILKDGAPDEVIDFYNALVAIKENDSLTVEQRRQKSGWLHTRSGSYKSVIRNVRLLDEDGQDIATVKVGQSVTLVIDAEVTAPIPRLVLGVLLRDRIGNVIWGTNTFHTNQVIEQPGSGTQYRFCLSFDANLGPGSYAFSIALTQSDAHVDGNFDWQDNVLVFDVFNFNQWFFVGCTALNANFTMNEVKNGHTATIFDDNLVQRY